GVGFVGGRWDNGHFFYNRAVMNVNGGEIRNVYDVRVDHETVNHVSYNGHGGIDARPTSAEDAAARDRHVGPVAAQTQHMQAARGNPQMRASVNQGRPSVAATQKPGEFSGRGVVAAREAGAPYHAPENRGAGTRPAENNRPQTARPEENSGRPAAVHPKDLPPMDRLAAPNTGNAKLDKKYQKQQDKLAKQQDKERQKLQQQQDREHQNVGRQNGAHANTQKLEQKHQQQTQQLQQKHVQQRQALQQRQAPAPRGGARK
ncbi:MAG: hypothetical protein WBX38_21240, partial [Candidatus Sulfotelmatobacter sp.]